MGEWRRMLLAILGLVVVPGGLASPRAALAAPAQADKAGKRAETEAQLQALKTRIEQIRDTVGRETAESDRLTKELRAAETDAGAARGQLDALHREQADGNARRAALAAERQRTEGRLTGERQALAAQMRLAWRLGPQEPLKLLLNQRDPARAGRMFAYYGYFGRARAAQLAAIQTGLERLQELDGELADQARRLAELESRGSAELARLDAARVQRNAALVSIKAESLSNEQVLQRLLTEQAALENLLRQLAAAQQRQQQKFPSGNGAFAGLRGQLAWPVSGRVAARYGDTRAGGLKWDGVLIDTERGADVRAVYGGRVVYADWLPGLGLLAIIDHGGGWLSLYGHNDRLFKSVGEAVQAGDVIASSGDSGGGSRPQLYFALRKGSRPQDPGPWFKQAQPVP